MYLKTILISVIAAFGLLCQTSMAAEDLSHITGAGGTIYFAWDGEAASYSADAGAGTWSNLGGNIAGTEGDASVDCPSSINTSTKHYTVLSNEAAAQGAIQGSNYAMKTPYDGACNNESTSRDRSVISLDSDKTELYIRWYQKFSGNWMNGSVQHKLTKFTPLSYAGNDAYSSIYFTFRGNETHFSLQSVANVDGQFNGDGVTARASTVVIFSAQSSAGSQYEGVNRYWDNYNNGLGDGGADGDFEFQAGQWYLIEMHMKMNSDGSTADAVVELWVNETKVFGLTGFKFYGVGDNVITGAGFLEMQHIYYTRATSDDQPTYMDNIVVADSYIGPVQGEGAPPVPATVNISIGGGSTLGLGGSSTMTIK